MKKTKKKPEVFKKAPQKKPEPVRREAFEGVEPNDPSIDDAVGDEDDDDDYGDDDE